MLRKRIKRYMPSDKRMGDLRLNYYFGNRINNPRLWMISRLTVSRATAIGLFCAYLPMPFEMVVAAFLAIVWHANLPISVMLVWISNPLTWVLIYTPPYLLGLAITGDSGVSIDNITLGMMMHQLSALWIGCLIFGAALAVAGYILSNVIWRMIVVNQWSNRRKNKQRNLNDS